MYKQKLKSLAFLSTTVHYTFLSIADFDINVYF